MSILMIGGVTVAAVIGVLSVQNLYLGKRINGLKSDVVAREATISAFERAQAETKKVIDQQNASIEVMRKESAARVAAANKAKQLAADKAATAEIRIRELMSTPVSGDSCANACALLRSPLL